MCCCGGGGGCTSPTINGNVKGCSSRNAEGVTVEAHDSTSGGTLLGSTTTDSSGNYSLSGLTGATSGNNIVLVYAYGSRFNAATTTLTYTSGTPSSSQWSCGVTTSGVGKTLSVASGYRCCGLTGCAIPIPNTLYVTTSYGSWTCTWNGTVYSSAACVTIPVTAAPYASTTTFDCDTPNTGDMDVEVHGFIGTCSDPFKPEFLTCFGYIPGRFKYPSACSGTGTIDAGDTFTLDSYTCLPYSATFTWTISSGTLAYYLFGGTLSVTQSE